MQKYRCKSIVRILFSTPCLFRIWVVLVLHNFSWSECRWHDMAMVTKSISKDVNQNIINGGQAQCQKNHLFAWDEMIKWNLTPHSTRRFRMNYLRKTSYFKTWFILLGDNVSWQPGYYHYLRFANKIILPLVVALMVVIIALVQISIDRMNILTFFPVSIYHSHPVWENKFSARFIWVGLRVLYCSSSVSWDS